MSVGGLEEQDGLGSPDVEPPAEAYGNGYSEKTVDRLEETIEHLDRSIEAVPGEYEVFEEVLEYNRELFEGLLDPGRGSLGEPVRLEGLYVVRASAITFPSSEQEFKSSETDYLFDSLEALMDDVSNFLEKNDLSAKDYSQVSDYLEQRRDEVLEVTQPSGKEGFTCNL